jgi:CheY-like chemotaxis protein
MYADYLAFCGYRVATADSGESALECIRREKPAVVLMDIQMPGLSGADTLRIIRADPALEGLPVLAFTAHALEHEKVEQLVAGFDAVVVKPCLPDDLVALIGQILHPGRIAS